MQLKITWRADGGEDGYATITAIILCAAISFMCAGILGVTLTLKRQSERQLLQIQQTEAVNTAVLEFSTELIRTQGDATFSEEKAVSWSGGRLTVNLRAEYEGRKWPLARLNDLDETVLSKYTTVSKQTFMEEALSKTKDAIPREDCLRSLLSPYGNTDPKKAFPQGAGLIASAGGHDGQVWRIRASAANMVKESYVRFIGDSAHLYAVIRQENFAVANMPDCRAMKVLP